MLPISILWYLQLGMKNILSSWRAVLYSLLTIYFSYVLAEIKRLFFEKIVEKLGITCNITAGIWLLRRFLNEWIWKTRYCYYFYKPTEKGIRFHLWKFHVTMTKKRKKLLIWKCDVTRTKKDVSISNEMHLQNPSSTFIHKNISLLSATSFLSRSPMMAYNTTLSLDELTCTDYMDFGKCQDRLGRFFWSKNASNYLDLHFTVFKKDDNKEFRPVQNLTIGEADFNQFLRLRKQLVNAAEKTDR